MDKDAYKEMFHGWIAKAAEYKIAIGIAAVCTVIILISLVWPSPQPETPISEVQTTPPPSHVFTVPAAPAPAPATAPAIQPSQAPSPMEKELSAKPLFPAAPTPAPKPPAPKPQAAAPAPMAKPITSTPKPKPAAPAATVANMAPTGYYIQVGSFKDKQRAITLAGKLQNENWPSLIVPRPDGMHGVWVGPYKAQSSADKAKLALKKGTGLSGFVYKNP